MDVKGESSYNFLTKTS